MTVTQDVDVHGVPPSQGASIKVISTKDGVQREVTYGSLDKKAQEEVLTDLLVKSAVHYAMKKQQVCPLILIYNEKQNGYNRIIFMIIFHNCVNFCTYLFSLSFLWSNIPLTSFNLIPRNILRTIWWEPWRPTKYVRFQKGMNRGCPYLSLTCRMQ